MTKNNKKKCIINLLNNIVLKRRKEYQISTKRRLNNIILINIKLLILENENNLEKLELIISIFNAPFL